uniref:Uncharacterized protein n=1 Tax=Hyaloperonospora arabidopsidis (strain Emoy2) TaxID=559515 RepID=M4BBQ6_HYAAE
MIITHITCVTSFHLNVSFFQDVPQYSSNLLVVPLCVRSFHVGAANSLAASSRKSIPNENASHCQSTYTFQLITLFPTNSVLSANATYATALAAVTGVITVRVNQAFYTRIFIYLLIVGNVHPFQSHTSTFL